VTTLREIMSTTVVALDPQLSLTEAAERLAEARVSGAPVVEGGRVVGVISGSDLTRMIAESATPASGFTTEELRQVQQTERSMLAVAARRAAHANPPVKSNGALGATWPTPSPARVVPLRRSVGEVMTRDIVSLPPDADVAQAALLMRRERVHRVLVMESGTLLGVVSALDLAKVGVSARSEPSDV
jgi:CBS domain-containing protein